MATPASHPRSAATVLIIDADSKVVELLATTLRYQGFAVTTAATGPAGLDRAHAVRPDVVLLEVTLPGMAGSGVLRRLRADGIDAPVVFLAAHTSPADKVWGLTVGSDDYIVKPFSVAEVLVRIRAILRRRQGVDLPARLFFADIELDTETHEAWKNGDPVQLSPTEFILLHYFLSNPGKVLSKRAILDHVWPYDFRGDPKIVETFMSKVRRKVDAGDNQLLHTIRGVGYALREAG